MSKFRPLRNTRITIGQATYGFMPHPHFPNDDDVFAMEGGEAVIYQVRDLVRNTLYALKVSKPSYRLANGGHILRATTALAPYKHIPGLYLGNRLCLTKTKYPRLIADYPDLEYAILMPWITGRTWAGLMSDETVSAYYSPVQAYELALFTAKVLWDLESYHLAHTDIAGGNILLSPDLKQVQLLDIEGLYMPHAPMPKLRSLGSPGYQHRKLDQRGQWCPEGDRFAGAILLTEILTWADPTVRKLTPNNAETLFQPQELQVSGRPRWEAVRQTLWKRYPSVLHLFDQAWTSPDLAQCPDFGTWTSALIQAHKA